jgi:hypothetical protein
MLVGTQEGLMETGSSTVRHRSLVVPDFGWWFSGFFDGEGSFILHGERRGATVQYVAKIQVMLRDDDAEVLDEIQRRLGCGRVYRNTRRALANPHALFRVGKVQELAEIIVPLFETYPLRSKKSREFAFWKEIVLARYADVACGQTRYSNTYIRSFESAREKIGEIRNYAATSSASTT